jgi:hypothetical protein
VTHQEAHERHRVNWNEATSTRLRDVSFLKITHTATCERINNVEVIQSPPEVVAHPPVDAAFPKALSS